MIAKDVCEVLAHLGFWFGKPSSQ